MTDHDIHPGDTIGDYTITGVFQIHDGPNARITIEATGNPPTWFGAPVIKISRGDWHSYLLYNEFGGGYRAADGSLHAVNHIIDQARRNGYAVEGIGQ